MACLAQLPSNPGHPELLAASACLSSVLNEGCPVTEQVWSAIMLDLFSRIWITYRRSFPPIGGAVLR